jgi:hypothetical protein
MVKLGGFTVDEIKNKISQKKYLEAFISVDNRLQHMLRQMIFYKFKVCKELESNFWELLYNRNIDRFVFLKDICFKFDLITDPKLKDKITNFNKFRTRVIHEITTVEESELIDMCRFGLNLINEIEPIVSGLRS